MLTIVCRPIVSNYPKRLVLKLVFAEKLAFHPQFGFETAQKSPFISVFGQLSAKNSQDVEMAGVEPACNRESCALLRSVESSNFLLRTFEKIQNTYAMRLRWCLCKEGSDLLAH